VCTAADAEKCYTPRVIHEGHHAPAFSAPDQSGRIHTLDDYRGSWLLLYFYPKDDTAGCTAEACGLRDSFQELRSRGVSVVGVSADDGQSHAAFAQKFSLPFPLLADTEKRMIKEYGAWGEKSLYGKKYMGILRTSFLIDPDGIVRKVYEKVKPEQHAVEILRDIDTLR
jgi:thioredoxin-dependent peroxiredoxin